VTHAEWYAEVLETYCWTLLIASQLGVPISQISEKQGNDLLAIKKKLGLPDIRFDASRMKECQLSDLEVPSSIALTPTPCDGPTGRSASANDGDLESLVKSVTDAVMDAMRK
jgi:L-fuculose-phosphate aldolase